MKVVRLQHKGHHSYRSGGWFNSSISAKYLHITTHDEHRRWMHGGGWWLLLKKASAEKVMSCKYELQICAEVKELLCGEYDGMMV